MIPDFQPEALASINVLVMSNLAVAKGGQNRHGSGAVKVDF
jgi:hypothetical protein